MLRAEGHQTEEFGLDMLATKLPRPACTPHLHLHAARCARGRRAADTPAGRDGRRADRATEHGSPAPARDQQGQHAGLRGPPQSTWLSNISIRTCGLAAVAPRDVERLIE